MVEIKVENSAWSSNSGTGLLNTPTRALLWDHRKGVHFSEIWMFYTWKPSDAIWGIFCLKSFMLLFFLIAHSSTCARTHTHTHTILSETIECTFPCNWQAQWRNLSTSGGAKRQWGIELSFAFLTLKLWSGARFSFFFLWILTFCCCYCWVAKSCLPLRPHELQHTRFPCLLFFNCGKMHMT